MLGYWPYATHKKTFYIYIFLKKQTQASQLIAINCGLDGIQQGSTRLLAHTSNQFCHCCMHMHATVAR